MGWEPQKNKWDKRGAGLKFAGKCASGVSIFEGDVILIARRYHKEPEVVGFGVVCGSAIKGIKGVKTPDRFGSARRLSPFIPLNFVPNSIHLMKCLPLKRALVQLHPDNRPEHKRLCEWMKKRLRFAKPHNHAKPHIKAEKSKIVKPSKLQKNNQLDYLVQTQAKKRKAEKAEAKLIQKYQLFLNKQGRDLQAESYGNLKCDAYERLHNNLIEAKSSSKREYVRMAVGQLLDYAFQRRSELGEPNKAILLPKCPEVDIQTWLKELHISTVWPEGGDFLDNANGQFASIAKT